MKYYARKPVIYGSSSSAEFFDPTVSVPLIAASRCCGALLFRAGGRYTAIRKYLSV